MDALVRELVGNPLNVVVLVLPGLVAHYVFDRLMGWSSRAGTHTMLRFSVLTLAYLGVALTTFQLVAWPLKGLPEVLPSLLVYIGLFVLAFIFLLGGPIAFAIFAAVVVEKDWVGRIAKRVAKSLPQLHPIPSAWEWKFSRIEPAWVSITFEDGKMIHGYCGEKSFISSDYSDHDIVLEKTYKKDSCTGKWKLISGVSVFVSGNSIRSIEFLSENPEESSCLQTKDQSTPDGSVPTHATGKESG